MSVTLFDIRVYNWKRSPNRIPQTSPSVCPVRKSRVYDKDNVSKLKIQNINKWSLPVILPCRLITSQSSTISPDMCWVVVTDIITFVLTLVLIISFPISFGCRLTWWAFLPLAAVLVPSWGLPYPGSPGFRCTWEDHWKLLIRGKHSELYVKHEPLTKEENTKFENHNAKWTTSWVNCWPLACEESLHCDQVKY